MPNRLIFMPLVRASRPNFLSLAILCVLLGIAAAHGSGPVDAGTSALVLLAALLAHLSVNLLNEYHDFRSGLDFTTQRTAFSGGSGALPAHPEAARAVGFAGVIALAAAVAIGLYFVAATGWVLLPLGLVGIGLVATYTPLLTHRPWLCLFAPGIGFGPVIVCGSACVLAGRYSSTAIVAGLPALFFASALLLLNQFPDVDADRSVGRRTLPMVIGRRRSAQVFSALHGAAYASIIAGVATGTLPRATLLALLALPASIAITQRVRARAEKVNELVACLGWNIATIHAALLLAALGLWIG